jgi:hypothetical protein
MKAWENFGITEERYNSIMASGQQTVVEVKVSDPVERKKILEGFQSRFIVEVVEHLPHECTPEVFCMKFIATIAQSNNLSCTFLVHCSNYKSRMYQYSDGQISYDTLDGKGPLESDYFKLSRRINDPDNNKNDRRYIKQVLSVMDVYYPLPDDPKREQWEPEPSYHDLMN